MEQDRNDPDALLVMEGNTCRKGGSRKRMDFKNRISDPRCEDNYRNHQLM